MIEVKPKNLSWLFSAIYASNDITARNMLWNNLRNVCDYYKGPWLIGGDFNEVVNSGDKFGGRITNQKTSQVINRLP